MLLAWIGIFITMGITNMPAIQNHWNMKYGTEFVRNSEFSRDLWETINITLFHLHDELDIMEKELNENFQHYWTLFQHNAIDEIMRLFKGHWKAGKVYSPDKPTKQGLKYYAMVDALHYLYWFKLYRRTPNTTTEEKKKEAPSVSNDAIDHLPKDII